MATTADRPFMLARQSRGPLLTAALRIVRNPVGGVFASIIAILVLCAITAPWVTAYDPIATSRATFVPPSWAHPFGTDNIGRDQFSRVIYGSRISLYVGLLAVSTGILGGTMLGLTSGFLGGKFDLIAQRFVDSILALPGLVLALTLVSVLGQGTTQVILAVAIVVVPSSSRVVRAAVLSVRQNVYLEAAHALGAILLRILFRHVLPIVVAPILILISASLGGAILIEAGLSFLGLGTQPPTPSWGLMLSTSGRQYMETAPWLAIFPGIAISVTVLSFNMLGDVVRDVLDPRLRGSR